MEEQDIFGYIQTEINNYKTVRVPLTKSKDWNMLEHIERCTNVANGWFHSGKNDGLRPYDDLVTPIINVAFRSEGFDVKDITPFVDNIDENYKSFLVKKFHPRWARQNELDTFIDDVVETSIIYDLVLVKDVNRKIPEVVDLKTIAFCDQTDVMAAPICIRHQMTVEELTSFKGKWNDDKINEAILMSSAEKKNYIAGDRNSKTPSKYIEVFELRGNLPKNWIDPTSDMYVYSPQMHYVCFYTDNSGTKNGITLFSSADKPLNKRFKALKIDRIRSKGRACGKSIVESLFEAQVWNNYSAIRIRELLDAAALNLYQSASTDIKNQKLSSLKTNTIIEIDEGKPITRLDTSVPNITPFVNNQLKLQNDARTMGSASEAQLGNSPVSGTPFALQQLVVQEGKGMHEYRQGKIATFFADVLYRDFILEKLVEDMNIGVTFSEELSLDELIEISEIIATNEVEEEIKKSILEKGIVPTVEDRKKLIETKKELFMKKGNRRFLEIIKDELKDIPMDVYVNVAGKQRNMAKNADAITNIIREVIRNPQAFVQIPGLGKAFNELVEESGMSPIDFSQITKMPEAAPTEPVAEVPPVPVAPPGAVAL